MNPLKTFTALLATAALAGTAAAQTRPTGPPDLNGWGPSWTLGSRPRAPGDDGSRKPDTRFDHTPTGGVVGRAGTPLAVEVRLWADAPELKRGHEYQLRYQFRVHTGKGKEGPILGTAQHPGGQALTLATRTYDGGKWYGLEGGFDVTRKDLSGMTGLPDVQDGSRTVFLRAEPHVYDATDKKYLSPVRTPAVVVVATVGPNRVVEAVQPLQTWIAANGRYQTDAVVAALADLDVLDQWANCTANGVADVLESDDVPTAVRVKLIRAVPREAINSKLAYAFLRKLEDYARGADADLKAAAREKLAPAGE